MKTINQFNGTINELDKIVEIIQSNITSLDATIIALKKTINDFSNGNMTTTEPPMVIAVPSSDEINYHRGEVANFTQNFHYLKLRRN